MNANNQSIVKNAAKFLRRDMLEFCSRLPQLNWPPTLEELLGETRLPPPSIILFLTNLLKSPKHAVTDRIRRLVDSFAADFMYGVSGEITGKHYLLGHGLHSMTGNKESVQVTNRLGHCISYDAVLDIETAQAQKAVMRLSSTDNTVLPLKPTYDLQTVITVFWADNFNKNIDNDSGGGAVDMTTIMAFQEYGIGSISSAASVNLPKTKSRKLTVEFDQHDVILNNKQEPDITNFECVESNVTESVQEFSFHMAILACL